jgi:hypothetical protein
MNQIFITVKIGTIGELLVTLRLLQYGVQAAPPIKDSGNDLIAVRGPEFRAIQVKTRRGGVFPVGKLPQYFHLLALVHLVEKGDGFDLEATRIFILSREQLEQNNVNKYTVEDLGAYEISGVVIDHHFNFDHGEAAVEFQEGDEEDE